MECIDLMFSTVRMFGSPLCCCGFLLNLTAFCCKAICVVEAVRCELIRMHMSASQFLLCEFVCGSDDGGIYFSVLYFLQD